MRPNIDKSLFQLKSKIEINKAGQIWTPLTKIFIRFFSVRRGPPRNLLKCS